jgi:tetratricopeptide (TPR) repeat protein
VYVNVGTVPQADEPQYQDMLLRLPPPVALVYEWARPLAGDRADAALEEFTKAAGNAASWLGSFRHRMPPLFRGDDGNPLRVMLAVFADAHEDQMAPWLFEQAARLYAADNVFSAYLYFRAAAAASRRPDPEEAEALLTKAGAAAPGGRRLWDFFRAAFGSDVPALVVAALDVSTALGVEFPAAILQGLGGSAAPEPDDESAAFCGELAEHHPAFLEALRITVFFAAVAVLQRTPGQVGSAQMLLEEMAGGVPGYGGDRVGTAAMSVLTGPRSSSISLELAKTLCMRAAGRLGRDMSFDRDAAITRAAELALVARDRRLAWDGPSGEALAVAAQARAAAGNVRGALQMLLPPPEGTALATEAASQAVIRAAAEMAVEIGDIERALDLARRIADPLERRLATALGLTLRSDSYREAAAEYRLALEDPGITGRVDQQVSGLLGLSMVAELDDSEVALLRDLAPEMADMVRAQSFLTAGNVAQAQVLARRHPDLDAALQIRVSCLISLDRAADAVSALESYAARQGDERFLLQAALLAMSSGATAEAARLASRLASGNDPARRRVAREILIDAASTRKDWDTVLVETRRLIGDQAVAESDPERSKSLNKYRWAQVHALHELRRMDEACEVIRADPRLVPSYASEARLVVSVLHSIAPSVGVGDAGGMAGRGITQEEIVDAVLEAVEVEPADEELAAAAVATVVSMPDSEPPDFKVVIKARRLHQQFFDRFPDSTRFRTVPVDDRLSGLSDFLRANVAPAAQAAQQLARTVITGRIPASVFAALFGRNYAEMLICGSVGCYVVQYPDDAILAQEAEAARQAIGGTVVVDTSALFLAPVTLGQLTELGVHFEQLLITASQRDDILQAKISLTMRSPGWLGWDPVSERPTIGSHDPEVIEQWVREAEALASSLRWCEVAADPPADSDDPRHAAWSASIRLARERGFSLIADDAALRAAARSEGVPAFGSLQILSALAENQALPATALGESFKRLAKVRAADLPVHQSLRDIAEDDNWKPAGYAGFLLQRPVTWTPLGRGWQEYTSLITALPEKKPDEVAVWCAAAMEGLSLTAAPSAIPDISAALVTWTLLTLRTPAVLPPLLAYAEGLAARWSLSVDMLQAVVQRLVETAGQVAPPEMIGRIVLPLLSGLDEERYAKAVQFFFVP